MSAEEEFERLVQAARKAGAVLRDADVPHALGGTNRIERFLEPS